MYSDAAAVRLPEASLMRAMLKPIVTCADAGMSAALCAAGGHAAKSVLGVSSRCEPSHPLHWCTPMEGFQGDRRKSQMRICR